MPQVSTLLGYLIVASVSGSLGFLLGAILTSGKVSALYLRLQEAELKISQQGGMLDDLSRALRSFAEGNHEGPLDQSSDKAVREALDLIERK